MDCTAGPPSSVPDPQPLPAAPAPSSTRDLLSAWLAVVLFVAVLAVPGAADSPFGNAHPSSPSRLALVGAFGLAATLLLFRPGRVPGLALAALAALAIVKGGLGVAAPVTGWHATYTLTDTEPPLVARFIAGFSSPSHRVDRRIAFSGETFGLHFLNDVMRYGANGALQQRDTELPLQVQWSGYVYLPEGGPLTAYLRGHGRFWLELDRRGWAEMTDPDYATVTTPHPVSAGLHVVRLAYEKPAAVAPAAFLTLAAGEQVLVPGPTARDVERQARGGLLASLTTGVVIAAAFIAAVAIAVGLGRRRFETWHGSRVVAIAGLALAVSVGVAGWRHARPLTGTTVHLAAGGDPLMYEANAREIAQNGPLMRYGNPLGRGTPFYFYPLYPYVRAASLFVMGEDFAGSVVLNTLAVAVLGPLFLALGWARLPTWRALAGLSVLAWITYRHLFYFTLWGFTDCVYMALVFLALWAAVRAVRGGRLAHGVAAGVAAGLAAACRPSMMTFVPVLGVTMLLWPGPWPRARRIALAAAVVAGFLLGTSPFALRNYLVAGQPVLLVNSWIQLPYFLYPPEVPNPVGLNGAPPTLMESAAWALRIIQEEPVRSLTVELRKLGFCAGFTNLGFRGPTFLHAWHPEFTVLAVLFVVALVTRVVPRPIALVLVAFAVSHVTAMLMAAPWTYGYKSILPLQGAYLFAAAYLGRRTAADDGLGGQPAPQ